VPQNGGRSYTGTDISGLVGASRKGANRAMVLFREARLLHTDADGRIAITDGDGLAKCCN